MNLRLNFLAIIVLSLSHDGFSQIYSVGNGDGYSESLSSSQLDIYSVGTGDGFGFSSVGSVGTEVPLPVVLFLFKAERTFANHVRLEWQTGSEINNHYFVVERSFNGLKFDSLASVFGAGNSTKTTHYQYLDENNKEPMSYYRLKQVDFDGKYEHSKILSVISDAGSIDTKFVLFPNPAQRIISISGTEPMLANLEIYDQKGNVINPSEYHILQISGELISIDISALTNSVFYIKSNEFIGMFVKL